MGFVDVPCCLLLFVVCCSLLSCVIVDCRLLLFVVWCALFVNDYCCLLMVVVVNRCCLLFFVCVAIPYSYLLLDVACFFVVVCRLSLFC